MRFDAVDVFISFFPFTDLSLQLSPSLLSWTVPLFIQNGILHVYSIAAYSKTVSYAGLVLYECECRLLPSPSTK